MSEVTRWEIRIDLPGGGVHILWQDHPDYHSAIVDALTFADRTRGRVLWVEPAFDEGVLF